MKILHVMPSAHPQLGGIDRLVLAASGALVAAGHEVTVAMVLHVPSLGDAVTPDALPPGVSTVLFRSVGPAVAPIPVGLRGYLRDEATTFDVVHAHNYHEAPALLAGMIRPERTVVSPYHHPVPHHNSARILQLRRVYDPAAGAILRRTRRVICLSSGEAAVMSARMRVPAEMISIIPGGFDERTFTAVAGVDRQPNLFLCVARMDPHKRIDRALTAFARLPADCEMTVVGDGPERHALESLARELGIADRVLFAGRVGDVELRAWYARASVFVTLSKAESFGLTVVEALAAGCRVVCSDIPSFRDFAVEFPESVFLVDTETSPAAVADGFQRARRAEPRQVDVDRFRWNNVAETLATAYDAALDRTDSSDRRG